MSKRNPDSPWNPSYPPNLTPSEYEKQVVEWLRASSGTLESFQVQHLQHLVGPGGDYEFDAVAEFIILNGVKIIVLIECKRYSQPVEREKLLALWAKQQDVKANKAIMFATCGFQSGAIKYAQEYCIATITFVEGLFLYETKDAGSTPVPPPWANLPKFAGIFLSQENGSLHCSTIDTENIDKLSKWLVT